MKIALSYAFEQIPFTDEDGNDKVIDVHTVFATANDEERTYVWQISVNPEMPLELLVMACNDAIQKAIAGFETG